jgi:superfamily I DNA and/or RNA helicase/very-short-patch-repair endonuclease
MNRYFKEISDLIEDKPQWKLKKEVSIALLSFAKQVIEEDLKIIGIEDHPGIALIYEGSATSGGDKEFESIDDYEIDGHAQELIDLVYDADSSQHSAIIDALSGQDLVIEGPPGTGKSQTITNLISVSIAQSKKVLFISEKLVALKVVKKKLENAGLGDFCLELHSNKARTKDVLEEINQRLKIKVKRNSVILQEKLSYIETKKKTLVKYKDLINSNLKNNLNLKANQIIWRSVKYRNLILPYINDLTIKEIPYSETLTIGEINEIKDKLNAIIDAQSNLGKVGTNFPFWGFLVNPLSNNEVTQIEDILKDSLSIAEALEHGIDAFNKVIVDRDSFVLNYLNFDKVKKFTDDFYSSYSSVNREKFEFIWESTNNSKVDIKEAFNELNVEHKVLIAMRQQFQGVIKNNLEIADETVKEALLNIDVVKEPSLEFITPNEINQLVSNYALVINRFKLDIQVANDFIFDRGLPKILSANDLAFWGELLRFIKTIPIESIDYVGSQVIPVAAEEQLKLFVAKQQDAQEIVSKIENDIHLDLLPSDDILLDALSVFRQGRPFIPFLSSKWRGANQVFSSISKRKQSYSALQKESYIRQVILFKEIERDISGLASVKEILGSRYQGRKSVVQPFLEVVQISKTLKDANTGNAKLNKLIADTSLSVLMALSRSTDILNNLFTSYENINKSHQHGFGKSSTLISIFSIDSLDERILRLVNYLECIEKVAQFCKTYATNESTNAFSVLNAIHQKSKFNKSLVAFEMNEIHNLVFGEYFQGLDSDFDALQMVVNSIYHLMASNSGLDNTVALDFCSGRSSLIENLNKLVEIKNSLQLSLSRLDTYGKLNQQQWVISDNNYLTNLMIKLDSALRSIDKLVPWAAYIAIKNDLIECNLEGLVSDAEAGNIPFGMLAEYYLWSFYTTISNEIHSSYPVLKNFIGTRHSKIRQEFAELDKEIIALNGERITTLVAKNPIPQGFNSPRVRDKTDWALVNSIKDQVRPRITVRRLLEQALPAVSAIKPCFMMSPIAVAQYLPKVLSYFDIVIMDEASQIRVEEAIGAVARSKKMVIVGDSKQLPPTDFFDSSNLNDVDEYDSADAESILDACKGNFNTIRSLKWHYRSQHESLIAFSNHHFYKNELIIFPAPSVKGDRLGVHSVYLEDAEYEAQMNVKEAMTVVDSAINQILSYPKESLGIVSLNLKQKELIEGLFDKRTSHNPLIADYLNDWKEKNEEFFVKNLENVQGDERDVIFVSTTFGKAKGMSSIRQGFGPISRENGWKRLNVLFTRAKKSLTLFTSMQPTDIIDDPSTPKGTKMLRAYLEYAKTGIIEVYEETGLGYDSEFEEAVGAALQNAGYQIICQLGVSKFRIDMVVKHPDYQGSYLAAIECDGATYHSGKSARDRDRIRQEILENLGWKGRIWRIWSTDWYRNPDLELEKLISFLSDVRKLPVVKSESLPIS